MKSPFATTSSVCLALLGSLFLVGLLPLSAVGQVYEACSFEGFEGIGVYNFPPTGLCGEDGVSSFAPPSEVSACLGSFYIDPTNATQYLESLIKLTQDYYIFNDIAVNPPASVPAITPFDFPIYDIRVDIVAEMMDLLTKVQQEGQASPNLFLEVNEIYAKLYDAHVTINNDIVTAGLLDVRDVYILHEEVLKGDASTVVLSVPFPSDEFVLLAMRVHKGNTTETMRIVEIGGQSPEDFIISLANMPTGIAPYKSLGPRFQLIVALITLGTGIFSGRLPSQADLSKFLEDSIDIVYEDSSTSTWFLAQFVPCTITQNFTKADIEAELAQPGFLYANFENITDTLITAITKKKDKAKKPPVIELPPPTVSTRTMEGAEFAMVNDYLGYAIMEDFAVFKLQTFDSESMNNTESFVDAWTAMSNDAAANGVTKLIIDINRNGGGDVNLAYDLAIAMYPDAQWDQLANPYDLIFSQASDAYWTYISPFLASLGGENVTENLTDLLNSDSDSIVEKMARLVTAVSTFEALIPELKAVVDVFEYIAGNIVVRGSASEVELSILMQQILGLSAIYGGTVAGRDIGFFFGKY